MASRKAPPGIPKANRYVLIDKPFADFGLKEEKTLAVVFRDLVSESYASGLGLLAVLPKVRRFVKNPDLRLVLKKYSLQVRQQVYATQELLDRFGIDRDSAGIPVGMEALLRQLGGTKPARFRQGAFEPALISAVQQTVHNRIAVFGTLAALAADFARSAGYETFRKAVQEEKDMDVLLTHTVRDLDHGRLEFYRYTEWDYVW